MFIPAWRMDTVTFKRPFWPQDRSCKASELQEQGPRTSSPPGSPGLRVGQTQVPNRKTEKPWALLPHPLRNTNTHFYLLTCSRPGPDPLPEGPRDGERVRGLGPMGELTSWQQSWTHYAVSENSDETGGPSSPQSATRVVYLVDPKVGIGVEVIISRGHLLGVQQLGHLTPSRTAGLSGHMMDTLHRLGWDDRLRGLRRGTAHLKE